LTNRFPIFWREVSETYGLSEGCAPRTYILRRCGHSVVVDLDEVDSLSVLMNNF
jgi:hypothetical protein